MASPRKVEIVLIPVWERLMIHFFSFILGLWILFKRLLKWMWNPNIFNQKIRDNPPSCLVDTMLGQHKHVKLKVRVMYKIYF